MWEGVWGCRGGRGKGRAYVLVAALAWTMLGKLRALMSISLFGPGGERLRATRHQVGTDLRRETMAALGMRIVHRLTDCNTEVAHTRRHP